MSIAQTLAQHVPPDRAIDFDITLDRH